MTANVEPAKMLLPRRRWLAFLDCAAADEAPGGAKVQQALDEDINNEVLCFGLEKESFVCRSVSGHCSSCEQMWQTNTSSTVAPFFGSMNQHVLQQ